VSPPEGVLDTMVLPTVNTAAMGLCLAEISARHATEFIMMVLDGAGGHKAKRLPIPANMRLIPWPPWSPPLHPAEQVWDELREKWFINRPFTSLDQREQQLIAGLAAWEVDLPRIASLTGFDWITCVPLNAN
jgi:DDE superfamily endonuclease